VGVSVIAVDVVHVPLPAYPADARYTRYTRPTPLNVAKETQRE
jgi:hypothetical protein